MSRLFYRGIFILSSISLLYVAGAKDDGVRSERQEASIREALSKGIEVAKNASAHVKAQNAITAAANFAKASSTPAQEFRNYIVDTGLSAADIQAIADDLKKIGYTVKVNQDKNEIGIEYVSKMSLKSKDSSSSTTQKTTTNENIIKIINEIIKELAAVKNKVANNTAMNEAILRKVNDIYEKISKMPIGKDNGKALSELKEQIKGISSDVAVVKRDIADLKSDVQKILEQGKAEPKIEKKPEAPSVISQDINATSIDSVIDNYTINSKNEFITKIFENLRTLYPEMKDGGIIRAICDAARGISTLKIVTEDKQTEIDLLQYIKHLAELKKKHTKLSLGGLCKQDLANNRLRLETEKQTMSGRTEKVEEKDNSKDVDENKSPETYLRHELVENKLYGKIVPASVGQFENDANQELYTAWIKKKDLNKIRLEAVDALKEAAEKNKESLDVLHKIFADYGFKDQSDYKDNASVLYEILNLCSDFLPFISNLNKTYNEKDLYKLVAKYVVDNHIALSSKDFTFERLLGKYDVNGNAEQIAMKRAEERKAELEKMQKDKKGSIKASIAKYQGSGTKMKRKKSK